MDWAVLCSAGGYSSILVFWIGASPQHPSEFAVATDADSTQGLRAIARADSATIRQPQPVTVEHDGISNIRVGKSSAIYYWYDSEKRWVTLAGAN